MAVYALAADVTQAVDNLEEVTAEIGDVGANGSTLSSLVTPVVMMLFGSLVNLTWRQRLQGHLPKVRGRRAAAWGHAIGKSSIVIVR